MKTTSPIPAQRRPRRNTDPPARMSPPPVAELLYAIANPKQASSAAYVAICRSKARQTAPTLLAAQSPVSAGRALTTPIVGLVDHGNVADAQEETREPVIVLDVEVQLQVFHRDLEGGI